MRRDAAVQVKFSTLSSCSSSQRMWVHCNVSVSFDWSGATEINVPVRPRRRFKSVEI